MCCKRIILVFVLLLQGLVLFSQNQKAYIKIADDAFEQKNYKVACNYYKQILDINENDKIAYKYAESCRLSNNFEEADKWYKYILQSKNKDDYPLVIFWLGIIEKNKGSYQKAQRYFRTYYNKNKKSRDYYSIKAQHEVLSCEKAIYLEQSYKNVEIKSFNSAINSSYSEFTATDINDSILYFSSYHPINSKDTNYTARIFQLTKKDTLWTNLKMLDTSINKIYNHIANFSFTADNKTMYFSMSDTMGNSSKIYRSIFFDNKWQNPELLSKTINQDSTYTTQPSIANFQGKEYLLFVSDRPGGFGKYDIWYCEIINHARFGKVTNIGNTINSIENDVTPFFNEQDSCLYFSSEWYDNLGGYDIFKSKGDFINWTKPENLGVPINTNYNDLYYTLNSNRTKSYFSSNRPNDKSEKNETCCNDIYYLGYPISKVVNEKKIVTTQIKTIKQLVPITLYFHNDEPNPRTIDTITKLNYETTIEKYLAMNEIYRQEYSKGLKGEKKDKAIEDVELFFMNDVETGYNNLKKFTALLEKLCGTGQTIVITLKGYTSPLNTAEYNLYLAKRRISSLINYFNEYNNGVLKQYIKNNQIKLELIAYGKTLANKDVSDDPNDQRNSVYSPAASLERKIQIIAVQVNEK